MTKRVRRENPHNIDYSLLSAEEMADLEQEVTRGWEVDEASASAAICKWYAQKAWDDAEHARLRPAYVKANGGYSRCDLQLDWEE